MAPLWLMPVLFAIVGGQSIENFVAEVLPSECSTRVVQGTEQFSQYFDSTTLSCKPCSQNTTVQKTSADFLTCECDTGYKYTKRFGGSAVTCEKCPTGKIASDDGWECVTCPAGSPTTQLQCQCAVDTNIKVERGLDGSWVSSPETVACLSCVATNTTPNNERNRCIRCSENIALGTTCGCQTSNGYVKTGGFCFTGDDVKDTVLDRLNEIPSIDGTDNVRSAYFENHLRAAFAMCANKKNATACQIVANMCVLILYNNADGRICKLYRALVTASTSSVFVDNKNVPVPQLYYPLLVDADNVIQSADIPISFTFDPPMKIKLLAVRHSLNGKYLDTVDLTNGLLQLCETTDTIADAAYIFGTYYSYMCEIKADGLWDTVKHPLIFYDIYLNYTFEGNKRLYKVPLRFLDLRENDKTVNLGGMRDWVITRRMFLVDNQMTITTTGTGSGQSAQQAKYARYAKDIRLFIKLQDNTKDGKIYVPYFTIKYAEVSWEDAKAGLKVPITFAVEYDMSMDGYRVDFQIATGTISTLAVLYAGYRAWVWSKRAGRPAIDFPTIVNFIFYLASSLSNAFFAITFGIAFYWFIFFKRQSVVYLVHPDMMGMRGREWVGLFGTAFALRALSLIHMIIIQCSVDIFLIDWERPRGTSRAQDGKRNTEVPVSIWRTYFVANEWNEIQAKRKINSIFQIFVVVFFLEVVGFVNTTTKDPDGSVNKAAGSYQAEQSFVYRYALAVMVYIVVAVLQWIFFTFVYERFIEDKVQQFVDLCSMSNISVFIMAHSNFGYYIHGRSVHGKADTDMREMCEMMKREEEDLCGQRGLVPSTEQQTFMMSLPKRLRVKYEQVYVPAALENAGAVSRMEQGKTGGRLAGSGKEKSIEAYAMLNKFLCGFIDHSLRDVDYVVKDKTLLESIMDTEFFDATEKGIFYNDNGHSFDQVLFCGHEMSLILFDTLLFCIVDHIATNFVLAGVITYIITELVCLVRDTAARKNLARKTLVDERFLI